MSQPLQLLLVSCLWFCPCTCDTFETWSSAIAIKNKTPKINLRIFLSRISPKSVWFLVWSHYLCWPSFQDIQIPIPTPMSISFAYRSSYVDFCFFRIITFKQMLVKSHRILWEVGHQFQHLPLLGAFSFHGLPRWRIALRSWYFRIS